MLADYSKTLLIEFHPKRILMMYILNNVTKQHPGCIKNIMVEIRLKIDVQTIPTPYIVALNTYICVYHFPKLPNLVSPITELTSQLDLH